MQLHSEVGVVHLSVHLPVAVRRIWISLVGNTFACFSVRFLYHSVLLSPSFLHVLVFKVCVQCPVWPVPHGRKKWPNFSVSHCLFTPTSAAGVHAHHLKEQSGHRCEVVAPIASVFLRSLFVLSGCLGRLHAEQYLVEVIRRCSHLTDLTNPNYL